MAFTVTTLSWAALFYNSELKATGELGNVHSAIRWGTDYFLKASSRRERLYVQVMNPIIKNFVCIYIRFYITSIIMFLS